MSPKRLKFVEKGDFNIVASLISTCLASITVPTKAVQTELRRAVLGRAYLMHYHCRSPA
jgi:hypothetical protein